MYVSLLSTTSLLRKHCRRRYRERAAYDYIFEWAHHTHLRNQQKTHFCLPTKVRFLNDVCLRQMMLATPMMTASPNDVCLTAHWANIASLRNKVEQHHICEANASYRRRHKLWCKRKCCIPYTSHTPR